MLITSTWNREIASGSSDSWTHVPRRRAMTIPALRSTRQAIGLAVTDEMLELARRNAAPAGASNVTFAMDTIEVISFPDSSVDVAISNCVITLAVDKPAVLRAIARVLRPGGRVGVTDIVAANELTPGIRALRGGFAECVAGTDAAELVATRLVAHGLFSAIVQARKLGVRPTRAAAIGR